jgi:predicted metal-dependent hydrolase
MDVVEVRRSPRARRWRLEVPWGEPVRLTVPSSAGRAEIQRILDERRAWIEQQRSGQVPRLGLDPFAVSEARGRAELRALVCELTDREAARVGVAVGRIRVGGQRTLWGSCSASGTLSFNWRLVLAPREVLDYVVVHELCHLHVPDHSRRFWALVERHRPRFREQREWLREYGPELLAFRPSH